MKVEIIIQVFVVLAETVFAETIEDVEKKFEDFYENYFDWKLKTWPEFSSSIVSLCLSFLLI
jgi:hypothetical protein